MFFPSEEQFPNVMRLSPYVTIHHNYRVYEQTISNIVDGHN